MFLHSVPSLVFEVVSLTLVESAMVSNLSLWWFGRSGVVGMVSEYSRVESTAPVLR